MPELSMSAIISFVVFESMRLAYSLSSKKVAEQRFGLYYPLQPFIKDER